MLLRFSASKGIMRFPSIQNVPRNISQHLPAVALSVILIAILFAIPAARPQTDSNTPFTGFVTSDGVPMRSMDIEISLQDDGSAIWRVEMAFSGNINRSAYLVLANIEELRVKAGDKPAACLLQKQDFGTLIDCPYANTSPIVYSFKTPDIQRTIGNFKNFAYSFRISQPTDFFALKISLPLGAAIVDSTRLEGTGLAPFRPSFGREGSNGRLILITWEISSPRVGDVIDSSVIYEQIAIAQDSSLLWIALILAVIAGFFGWFLRFRDKPERLLPALSDRERPVMELIIKSKTLDQRDIVRATNWPKAKVSRAIRVLSDRGLVEALPKGRTKEVRLMERQNGGSGLLNKILRFKIKQRANEMGLSRGQAIELVQTTITPLIDWAEKVSNKVHSGKFGYSWNANVHDFELDGVWKIPLEREHREKHLRDVKSVSPKLEAGIESAEKYVAELEKNLELIKDKLLSDKKFIEACRNLKSKGHDVKPEQLVCHSIDRDKIINDSYPWARAWNQNARGFIKIMGSSALRKPGEELESSAGSLRRCASSLKEELEAVRDQFRRQYHILYKEYRA